MHILCTTILADAKNIQLHTKNEQFQRHLQKIYIHHNLSQNEKERLEKIWSYHFQHPINLYPYQAEKLQSLYIASAEQIHQLTQYLQTYGSLASPYELQAVPSWDTTTIELIMPFITIQKPWYTQAQKVPTSTTYMAYLTPDKVLQKTPPKYLGNPAKVLLRYQVQKPNFYRFSLIASKEPYEPFYWNGTHANIYGPLSYWGGYGMIENIGCIQKCIIGDYQVGLGQGLILGTPFSIDKSQEVIKIMKASYRGIQPTCSFQRKSSFRGLACSLQKDEFLILLFTSLQNLDITLHRQGNAQPYIKTLATRGIAYTTPNNLDKKDNVQEKMVGAALIYKNPKHNLKLGIQTVYSSYNIPINLSAGLYHNLFFQGKSHVNLSLFGNQIWKNYHFFGEIGHAQNNSLAAIAGTMASLGKKIDAACLLYYYPAHFHSLYGHAFGRKGAYNRNKRGGYFAIQYRPLHHLKLKGYIDIGQHLQPQKTLHHPNTYEQTFMASFSYQPTRKKTLTLTFKGGYTPKNAKGSRPTLPLLEKQKKGKITLKGTYLLKKKHDGYTQLQLSCLQPDHLPTDYGIGIKQLFHYKHEGLDLKWWFMLYNTPNYHTAIRLYTHNLRGGMCYPPHYGKRGFEAGFLIRYNITRHLKVGLSFIFNRAAYSTTQRQYLSKNGGLKISLKLTYK